jgi:hypothetical protein
LLYKTIFFEYNLCVIKITFFIVKLVIIFNYLFENKIRYYEITCLKV